jgi:hypothetical protein
MYIRDTAPSSTSGKPGVIDNEVRIADGEFDPEHGSEPSEILRGKLPSCIADTSLGLTESELQILRHQQQLVAQRSYAASSSGNSRSSQPSSSAASAASSQLGRLYLDPGSLRQLNVHFEHLMRRIENRNNVVGIRVYF